ncbi:hypothetical protein ACH4F6_39445 [Streptomyces sp. NPDC017936]|uniref:hypothetical protein n=1 Tax=Streptomyces sp. NPDC017936 TaxID=3365016 RepID=UPI0037A883D9
MLLAASLLAVVCGFGSVVDDDADGVGSVAAVGADDDLLHGFGEPFVEVGGDGAGAGVVGGVADAVEACQCGDGTRPGHLDEDRPRSVLNFRREVEVLVSPSVLDQEFPGVAVGVESGGGDARGGTEDLEVLLVRLLLDPGYGLGRFGVDGRFGLVVFGWTWGRGELGFRRGRFGRRCCGGAELPLEVGDAAADGYELTADVRDGAGDDLVGAGDGFAGDGSDLGEAGVDGGGGVLPDLVDGVLLAGDLLLDGGEAGTRPWPWPWIQSRLDPWPRASIVRPSKRSWTLWLPGAPMRAGSPS